MHQLRCLFPAKGRHLQHSGGRRSKGEEVSAKITLSGGDGEDVLKQKEVGMKRTSSMPAPSGTQRAGSDRMGGLGFPAPIMSPAPGGCNAPRHRGLHTTSVPHKDMEDACSIVFMLCTAVCVMVIVFAV